MRKFLFLLLAAVITMPTPESRAQRETVALREGWRFLRADAAPDAPTDAPPWQGVSVPHGWNNLDGQDGTAAEPGEPSGYYRGPAWYVRALDVPAAWQNRRVFIRFEAAFLVADVYLNGVHLGQHRGGFAAFCYELTAHLRFGGPNELRVRVDNARNEAVAPLEGDFTMEGGLYRPVQLLVTGSACISPLDFAGPGVYARTLRLDDHEAAVEVETKIDEAAVPLGASPLEVDTEICDAEGRPVASQVSAAGGASTTHTLRLPAPHLWQGRRDPYLYTVRARLRRDGQTLDEVSQPQGLRTVAITEDQGFLLNGQPYPIQGVNRHQEKRDQGWVMSPEENAADFALILDVGATAVRLAHYQQAEDIHTLCDHNGLLLWQEIPLVNAVSASRAFADNARQQLTEMIRQGCNHPSIFTWSLGNELYNARHTDPPEDLIAELNQLAAQLDPTRQCTAAACFRERKELNRITPWLGYNLYPGWYSDQAENFDKKLDDFYRPLGKRLAISEYGAGGNPDQHEEGPLVAPKAFGDFHPEEWQAHVVETDWAQIRINPHLWGSFLWLMFDFASDGRNEGGKPGVNDKGLVTEDRKIKKDAYFFYQANWSTPPMVYVASRRMTPRRVAQTEIKVYSNCPRVELFLNDRSMGSRSPDEVHVCRWPGVTLQTGCNELRAVGSAGETQVNDGCEWMLAPAQPR